MKMNRVVIYVLLIYFYIGYEGQDCSSDIDECRSSPCQNGGSCTDGIGNYTCQCIQRLATVPDGNENRTYLTGYEGTNCEHDVDECLVQPTVCLNGGDCENEAGTFQCKCCRDSEGNYYSGSHCEVSTSYCVIHPDIVSDPPACKNNGTCTGLVDDYQCTCGLGFEGRRCELNIDECESNSCQYNGTCVNGINGYVCDCIPGIMGDNCEQNIDECNSSPCLHAGQCIDHINRFDCNCTDTGFKGNTCEVNIDDCEPESCTHGATCYDLIKDYNCTCLPGYNGKECQNDIDECASTPCHYDSGCLQKSNETLYDLNYPGFENTKFSFTSASGYICECVPGSIGMNCEINIDDCQHDNCNNGSCFDLLNRYRCDCFPGYEGEYCDTEINECTRYTPCLHGSTCTDKIADYDCECPPLYNGRPYAGKNCTFELTSCQSHECHNEAVCQPYLINEITSNQDYECICTEGFTERYCNISTTMSFDTGSYVEITLNLSVHVALSFRFRTTLQDAILFAWIGRYDSFTRLFTTVELKEGNLYIGYHANAIEGLTNVSISNKKFNDGEWHNVVLTKTDVSVSMTLSSTECMASVSDCLLVAMYDPAIQATKEGYFGSLLTASLVQQTVSSTEYVGCMEDITVWGTRLSVDMHTVDHSFHVLSTWCPRSKQCFHDTCNSNGDCVDLWNKHRCDCDRPHLGDTCETGQPDEPTHFTYLYKDNTHTFSWTGGFNGGYSQTFVIQTSIVGTEDWINRTTITQIVPDVTSYQASINALPPGIYIARIFAWTIKGTSEYVRLKDTFSINKKESGQPEEPTHFTYLYKDNTHTFSWVGGFNGGYTQTFVIQTSIVGTEDWINRTTITQILPDVTSYQASINALPPGIYIARIFAWTIKGTSEYVGLNDTLSGVKIETDPEIPTFPVAVVAGWVATVIVVLIIATGLVVFYKRRYDQKERDHSRSANSQRDTNAQQSVKSGTVQEHDLQDVSTYEVLDSNNEAVSTYSSLTPAIEKHADNVAYDNLQLHKLSA